MGCGPVAREMALRWVHCRVVVTSEAGQLRSRAVVGVAEEALVHPRCTRWSPVVDVEPMACSAADIAAVREMLLVFETNELRRAGFE